MDKIEFKLADEHKNVLNFNRSIRQSRNAINVIDQKIDNSRLRQTINNYIYALDQAENQITAGMHNDLLQIYRTIVLDANLTANMNMRCSKTKMQEFNILNGQDEKDEELEKIFRGKWFYDFVDLCIKSIFWGYSVVQMEDIVNSKITGVKEIDPFHVLPRKKQIRRGMYDLDGIDIDKFDALFISSGDLGLLHKCAPYLLYKKELLSQYASYVETFGEPFRFAKAGVNTDQNSLYNMLHNMGSKPFGIFSADTEIEFMNGIGTGNDVFKEIIAYLDQQVNLLVMGNRDVQNNYSEADKNADKEDNVSYNDNMLVQEVINTQLIPLLIKLGYTELENAYFEYTYTEKMDVEKQFAIDQRLIELGYVVDNDYLINKYGTDITGFRNEPVTADLSQEQTMEEEIENKLRYKNIFNTYYNKNN